MGRIIKECPFEHVKTITLERYGNILISRKENKLFQTIKNSTICDDIPVIETAEGFFLSTSNKANKLKKVKNNIIVIDDLLLTEIDYQQMSLAEFVTSLFAINNQKLCQLYKSFVNLYSKMDDEFFAFSNFMGNEAYLYSNEGQIFVPNCVSYSEIILIDQTKECYRDLPIKIKQSDGSIINVFLTSSLIIRTTSKLVPCKNNNKNIHLPKSKRIIRIRGNKAVIGDDSQYRRVPINLQQANITELNFKHDDLIISSINIVKKAVEIKSIIEGVHGEFHGTEDHQTELRMKLDDVVSQLAPNIWKEIEAWFTKICSYIAFGFGAIMFIFLTVSWVRNGRKNNKVTNKSFL